MKTMMSLTCAVLVLMGGVNSVSAAKVPALVVQPPQAERPPQFVSPEVSPDRKVTFRIYAPKATEVRLSNGDIPGNLLMGGMMKKDDKGVWELTTDVVPGGAYRYNFTVDGVAVTDPRNPAISESLGNSWSLVVVPGVDTMETKNVPHGAVASVTYYSTALSKDRRMHIYTPPGYEKGSTSYPVFYLLHGAGDSDDAWTSVGRAGFIMDNLIASGKAKPMIVVMPAGHTSRAFRPRAPLGTPDEFVNDFNQDIRPYVESHYRTINDRADRAIAGLSMGGFQTLNVAIPHLTDFAYVGVYSSGLFGIVSMAPPGQPAPPVPNPFPWEEQNKAILDNADAKKGLKLFWFGIGKEDFLYATSNATVALLKKHGFDVVNHESVGGHTWLNWRDYLIEFAPKLFQ